MTTHCERFWDQFIDNFEPEEHQKVFYPKELTSITSHKQRNEINVILSQITQIDDKLK